MSGVPASMAAADGGSYGAGVFKGDVLASIPGRPQPMGHALPGLSVRAAGPGTEIRWEHFNYPPLLRVIHFDINEVPLKLRKAVRLLNVSFILTTLTCIVNLVDTAILVSFASVPFKWLIQSMLHLLILSPAALAIFYIGYRGIVAPEPLLTQRFQSVQIALAILFVMFATLPWHCINGLIRLAYMQQPFDLESIQVFWVIAIVLESTLWLLSASLALLNVLKVRRINLYPIGVFGPTKV